LASTVQMALGDGPTSVLVINEVSDAGTSNACDTADWIELLNVPYDDDDLARKGLEATDNDCDDDYLLQMGDDDVCAIDLSGYKLCDSKGCDDEDAYTFPSGSKIQPGEHKVICKGDGGFAFGIGGDDTVSVVNKKGKVLDVAGPLPDQGGVEITWARIPDGTGNFMYTAEATPGAPNVAKEIPQSIHCLAGYDGLSTGDTCEAAFTDLLSGNQRLLPTESSVGHAWVIRQMYDDFETEADAVKWMSSHEFPVVLHNGQFYLTDRHHHAVALHLSGHGSAVNIILKIVCDYRSVTEANFWNEMVASNYALAYDWSDDAPEALPSPQDFSKMPMGFDMSLFGDNQWRSLAGFASSDKWSGWEEEERCYVQTCSYFVDFGWAYLFTESASGMNGKWPSDASVSSGEFLSQLRAMPRHLTIADYDETDWHNLAGLLHPLCHSAQVQNHPLPQFFPGATLQGWSTVPLPKDPDCAAHTCGSSKTLFV